MQLGDKARERGQYEEAEMAYREALKLRSDATVAGRLGLTLAAAGSPDTASRHLMEALERERGGSGVAVASPSPPHAQPLPLARRVLRSRWTAFAAGGALVYLLLHWQHRTELLACRVWPWVMPIPLECGGEQGSSEQSEHASVASPPSPMKRQPAKKARAETPGANLCA